MIKSNTVVVIAPHADDEVLGCGATIARHVSEGDKVVVAIMTNANIGAPELFSSDYIDMVRSETKLAHKILGVSDTIFLDYPAPMLDQFPSYKISIKISKILDKYKPKYLYLPFPGDMHLDHRVVYQAALVAARPQGDYSVKNIFCYETLSETDWSPTINNEYFAPNYFVNITDFFDKKIEAIKCFSSQLKKSPHPRSIEALTHLSGYRGATIGVNKAEAFKIERMIWS